MYADIFAHVTRQRGVAALGMMLILFLIIFLIIIFDMGFILFSACEDSGSFFECAMGILTEPEAPVAPQGSATATGEISGEYQGAQHTVTISMVVPLEGGDVTGTFSGDCDGTIKGSYTGGTISGSGKGSCGFVLPASGEFSGTLNAASKTVNISGTGRIPGFSKEGSLTLTY